MSQPLLNRGVMFFDDAFVTMMNAQEVANTIQAFYNGELGENFFKITVQRQDGSHTEDMWLRPLKSMTPYSFGSGVQIVKCEKLNSNLHYDLIIPGEHREVAFALLVKPR